MTEDAEVLVAEPPNPMRGASLLVPLPPGGASPDLNDPAVLTLARRIFFARYSRRVAAVGIDLDDGWQAACIGLVTRSRTASRWNPARGGLSTWLFVALRGITINLVDQQVRALRRMGSVGRDEDVSVTLRAIEEIREEELDEGEEPEAAPVIHTTQDLDERVDGRGPTLEEV